MNKRLEIVEKMRSTLSAIEVMREGGKSVSDACQVVGIAEYIYYRWSRKLHRNGNHMETETTPSEAGTMLATGMTLDEAKSRQEELQEKVAAVDALRGTGESARQACKQMDIDEGTYFYWKKKMEGRLAKYKPTKSRAKSHTKEEIIALLRESNNRGNETLKKWAEKRGIRPAYIHQWRKRYGEVPMEDAREIVKIPSNGAGAELKQLRIENQRLKMLVAEKCLDIMTLQEYAGRQ